VTFSPLLFPARASTALAVAIVCRGEGSPALLCGRGAARSSGGLGVPLRMMMGPQFGERSHGWVRVARRTWSPSPGLLHAWSGSFTNVRRVMSPKPCTTRFLVRLSSLGSHSFHPRVRVVRITPWDTWGSVRCTPVMVMALPRCLLRAAEVRPVGGEERECRGFKMRSTPFDRD
jgi:hypothetical protein